MLSIFVPVEEVLVSCYPNHAIDQQIKFGFLDTYLPIVLNIIFGVITNSVKCFLYSLLFTIQSELLPQQELFIFPCPCPYYLNNFFSPINTTCAPFLMYSYLTLSLLFSSQVHSIHIHVVVHLLSLDPLIPNILMHTELETVFYIIMFSPKACIGSNTPKNISELHPPYIILLIYIHLYPHSLEI